MARQVLGIHHVTAISGDPQATLDFYTGTLGLRMVKKTVNFDDPGTYHLYFGNESGDPGTLLTYFPWGSSLRKGRPGNGQVTAITLLAPDGSLDFWQRRLDAAGVSVIGPEARFGDEVIRFTDPDGIVLEIITGPRTDSAPAPWTSGGVDKAHAIRGMHSVTLSVDGYERSAGMLVGQLGFEPAGEAGSRFRYEVNGGGPGKTVDIFCDPNADDGVMGVGAVHHIAWRTENDQSQLEFLKSLTDAGYYVTPVRERNYFRSIYMREPGGVQYEIATDPPGMTIDEPVESLGEALKLPPWFESRRKELEDVLPELAVATAVERRERS